MTLSKSKYEHEQLQENFDNLLKKLQHFFNENEIKIDIYNTKFAKYAKEFKTLPNNPNMTTQGEADLSHLVIKYLQLDLFLNSKINIKKEDLKKIVCGTNEVNDTNDKYNGPFYELSMASRFIKKNKNKIDINLLSDCDIIIAKKLAIECKYIFSEKNLSENVSKAIDQIKNRIENKQATRGIVSLDLSNVIDKKEIITFTNNVFEKFKKHQKIINNQGLMYNKFNKNNDIINRNLNFIKIIQLYIQNEMEMVFLRSLKLETKIKMEKDLKVKAIVYQCSLGIGLEYNGEKIALPVRGLSYLVNSKLDKREKNKILKDIHKLSVGL